MLEIRFRLGERTVRTVRVHSRRTQSAHWRQHKSRLLLPHSNTWRWHLASSVFRWDWMKVHNAQRRVVSSEHSNSGPNVTPTRMETFGNLCGATNTFFHTVRVKQLAARQMQYTTVKLYISIHCFIERSWPRRNTSFAKCRHGRVWDIACVYFSATSWCMTANAIGELLCNRINASRNLVNNSWTYSSMDVRGVRIIRYKWTLVEQRD